MGSWVLPWVLHTFSQLVEAGGKYPCLRFTFRIRHCQKPLTITPTFLVKKKKKENTHTTFTQFTM